MTMLAPPTTGNAAPTSSAAALLTQVDQLATQLAGRSAEIEALRHLPPDIAQALAERGLLRLLTPAEIGGHELPVADYFAVIERLAMADASVAWCCFISCTTSVLAAYLPAVAAKALFGAPLTKAAGVFAPRGQACAAVVDGVDGWRVSGRWPWGSGARHADVISAGCLVIGDDGQPQTMPGGAPRVLSVVLPRSRVNVLDNWTAVGLCGSGSGEFEAQDVFVPTNHSASLLDPPRLTTPLYRFPVFGLLALSIAAVASGIARLALDDLQTLSGSKLPQGSTRVLAQRPATQEAVARAEAQWRSARAYVMQAVAAAWASAQAPKLADAAGAAGGDAGMPIAQRADLRLAATHGVQTAATVVDRMFTLGGGHAVFADSPLQRHLRNIHVATQHMMVNDSTYELVGRVQLGLPTAVGML